jgi:hypothetical protein
VLHPNATINTAATVMNRLAMMPLLVTSLFNLSGLRAYKRHIKAVLEEKVAIR